MFIIVCIGLYRGVNDATTCINCILMSCSVSIFKERSSIAIHHFPSTYEVIRFLFAFCISLFANFKQNSVYILYCELNTIARPRPKKEKSNIWGFIMAHKPNNTKHINVKHKKLYEKKSHKSSCHF